MPHFLSHLGFLAGQIGRLITISTIPVIAAVWFDGRIVNKEEDVKSYESDDVTFTEFNIGDLQVRFYGDTAIVVAQGSLKAHAKNQDLSGKYVWTDTFVKQDGEWKAVASQVTPVLKK